MESVPALMDDVIDAYLNQANEILDYDFGIDPLAPTPNEIIPNFLWLGSKIDANNTNKLGNLSITHILVCASLCSESKSEDIVSYKIYASDTTDSKRQNPPSLYGWMQPFSGNHSGIFVESRWREHALSRSN
eukprot:93485_1